MELIWLLAVTIVGVFMAAFSKLLSDEFKAWAPWIVERLIEIAVDQLPKDKRDRFAEEWPSHVNEFPGDLSRVIVALRLIVASWRYSKAPFELSKRFFDITMSIVAVVFLFPLALVTTLLIKLDTPGPILVARRCVGRKGQLFRVLQFRTVRLSGQNPDRVTPMGRLLLHTGIDKIPQLWNILRGDMSFVGPRPVSQIDASISAQFDVKPGAIDLVGLDDSIRDEILNPDRRAHDLYYVKNQSFLLDLKIFAKAAWRVFLGKRQF